MQKQNPKKRFAKTLLAAILLVGLFFGEAGVVNASFTSLGDVKTAASDAKTTANQVGSTIGDAKNTAGQVSGAVNNAKSLIKDPAAAAKDAAKNALGNQLGGFGVDANMLENPMGKLEGMAGGAIEKFGMDALSEELQNKFSAAQGELSAAQGELDSATRANDNAKRLVKQKQANLQKKQAQYDAARADLIKFGGEQAQTTSQSSQKLSYKINAFLLQASAATTTGKQQAVESKKRELAKLSEELKTAKIDLTTAQNLETSTAEKVNQLKKKVEEAQVKVDKAKKELDAIQADFEVKLQASFTKPPNITEGKECIKNEKDNYHADKLGNLWICEAKSVTWQQIVTGNNGEEILMRYTGMLYKWFAGFIGIIAVLMIVIGGIQISTAGSNQEGLQGGKDRIVAALVSLALFFLASLILYTINPTFFQ